MNYYERHIGDYLKDTAHLSLLEHGIYSRLLDVYYTREDGIGAKDVERLIGAKSKDERAALGVVLAEFFVLDGDKWKQGRCDREIARFHDKQRKASASANARWKKTAAQTDGTADAMRTHTEGNAPTHQTPDTSNQTPEENTHTPLTQTEGGRVCLLLRRAGVQDVNPGHPDLLALIAAGASDAEFIGAADSASKRGKGFAYALGTLKRQRVDAAKAAEVMHAGPMPTGPPKRQSAVERQIETMNALTGRNRTHANSDGHERGIEYVDVVARHVA